MFFTSKSSGRGTRKRQTARGNRRRTCAHPSSPQFHHLTISDREGATEVVEEYFDRLGGRPEPDEDGKPKKGKRKQSSTGSAVEAKGTSGRGRKKAKVENGADDDDTNGKAKSAPKWEPPKGTWEHEIMNIDCIEEELDEATNENKRVGFVMWNNGKKSKHSLKILNGKCPQKVYDMLKYDS